jgi:hypothetical protein
MTGNDVTKVESFTCSSLEHFPIGGGGRKSAKGSSLDVVLLSLSSMEIISTSTISEIGAVLI